MSSTCVYPSLMGLGYLFVIWSPFIIPGAIFAFSYHRNFRKKWGSEVSLLLFSFWLTVIWAALWLMQRGLGIIRPNPYCPDQLDYVHPSMPIYYFTAVVTYVIGFTYLWNIALREFYWVFCIGVFWAPSILLVSLYTNLWSEAVLSTLVGVLTTLFFLCLMRFQLMYELPWLMKQAPLSWYGPIDTYMGLEEQDLDLELEPRV